MQVVGADGTADHANAGASGLASIDGSQSSPLSPMLAALTAEYRRMANRLELLERNALAAAADSKTDEIAELYRQISTLERMILACEPTTPADAAAVAVVVDAYQMSVKEVDQKAAERGASAIARYLLACAGTTAEALGLGGMAPSASPLS